ncbi:MAG TPA: beta-propeller fold lactonase family protein [Trueperaceae bacterium]|nr:beta-propeller fold lactonase family protein [Trueperaceae bacterium]
MLALVVAVVATSVACRSADVPDVGRSATARSGPIALSPDGRSMWVVNPDADSVTRIDTLTLAADAPIAVGDEPWSVAVGTDGSVVVANRAAGSVSLIDAAGTTVTELVLGAEPSAVALSPDGTRGYVTLASVGTLVAIDMRARTVVASRRLAPNPSALVVVPAAERAGVGSIVVTHLLARPLPGGGPDLDDGMAGTVSLVSPDLDSVEELAIEPYGFGFANVLTGVDVKDGVAWVVHALNRPEAPIGFNRMVSAAVSSVPLNQAGPADSTRLEVNDPLFSTPVNAPSAVALTGDGRTAYVVFGGSDQLMGLDLSAGGSPRLLGFWPTGSNPRGVALSADGRTAYVMNYLSRDVSVIDISDARNRTGGERVGVVAETLDPELLLGKRLFFNASDARLSTLGWMSCASCHPGGGSDGTTWHFPEGPRQTAPLWSLGLRGPPFHASATRDELHDVQFDIEHLMRGQGLVPGSAYPLLGTPNEGRSVELDALAAFIAVGFRVPAAPDTIPGATTGRQVFATSGCAACHGGEGWTRNAMPGPAGEVAGPSGEQVDAVLFDVGTYRAGQMGLGADGFKVPTLLGLHASAPYLHSGAAADLLAVLANPDHVGTLEQHDVEDLIAFLLSIDAHTEPFE